MDTLSLVLDAFAPIAGRRLLDVGCGPGAMAAALAGHGARMTGIDPGEAALAAGPGSRRAGRAVRGRPRPRPCPSRTEASTGP